MFNLFAVNSDIMDKHYDKMDGVVINSQNGSKKFFTIAAVVLLLIMLGGGVGWLIRKWGLPFKQFSQISPVTLTPQSILLPLDHNVTLYATITNVDANLQSPTITVRNYKNQTAQLHLSPTINIFQQPTLPTVSNNPKVIEINKEALMIIQFKDGKYQVSSITYNFISSPSASPRK